jgi:hypothetical protein
MNTLGLTSLGLLLAAIGCAKDPAGPEAFGGLRTDRLSYVAKPLSTGFQYEFRIVARFENNSGRTLYIGTCGSRGGPVFGIGMADPEPAEASAYNMAWGCPAGAVAVEQGETKTDTLRAWGPIFQNWGYASVVEGRMRLYYDVRSCAECLDDMGDWGVSNEFEVSISE